jgi:ATP-dependent RNA helicase DOB1
VTRVLAAGKAGGKRKKGPASDCFRIIKMIMERNYDPVIVFCFSKRECESLALAMAKVDFNDGTLPRVAPLRGCG